MNQPNKSQLERGFTLIELLVVVVLIGILAAIAGPSWLGWVTQRRINAVNGRIMQAIEEARNNAQYNKMPYSVAFRVINGVPEVAVYEDSLNESTTALDATTQARVDRLFTEGRTTDVKPNEVMLMMNLDGENTAADTGGLSLWTGGAQGVSTVQSHSTAAAFWSANASKMPAQRITFDETGALAGDAETGLMVMVSMPVNGSRNTAATATTEPIQSKIRCVRVGTLLGGLQLGRSADECERFYGKTNIAP